MRGCAGVMAVGFAHERAVYDGVPKDVRAIAVRVNVQKNEFEYERRMNNWALWRVSERRSFGGSPFPVYNLTPRPPRGENIMPILGGEAEETDRAVSALPPKLRRAVEVWFLSGGSIDQKRKMLRCRRERMFEILRQARAVLCAG